MIKEEVNKNLSAVMVIFGGTGDLTHRKLMPALYNLVYDRLLPENFAVVSIGRKNKSSEQYRNEVFESLNKYSRNEIDRDYWARLREIIYYLQFDFTDQEGYERLKEYLKEIDEKYNTGGNRVFYLAIAPEYFELVVQGLSEHELAHRNGAWTRLVIEKPFGKDLKTARKLNNELNEVFDESSIYRIDHYLGKEMIQNIMVLRFCNTVFESLWSNKYIDN
ncbi:MAG: glucose-6-phosphate dehydrogenase, partial [Clostridiaceae bacterium]|nr:glucose-6-phosphate dehydrogenase [Clostridiaceae bacterium]